MLHPDRKPGVRREAVRHQDGKVTVPHEDFLAKIRAIRYAFLELGVDDGIIVARTDSLGAGLTKQIAVTNTPGDRATSTTLSSTAKNCRPTSWATVTSSSSATASCCVRSACRATCSSSRRHGRSTLRARLHHVAERRRPC